MFDKQIDIFFVSILAIISLIVLLKTSYDMFGEKLPNKSTTVAETAVEPEKKIERFIVADAQDFENYYKWRKEAEQKTDNFAPSELDAPTPNKVVDYDKEIDRDKDFAMMVVHGKPKVSKEKDVKAFVSDVDFGWEAPKQAVGCANASVSQQFSFGNKSLLPFKVGCNQPNKLTSENYYKTHYRPQVIPIEDYYIRGANYLDYTGFMSPYQERGYRILSQNTKGLPPDQNKIKNMPVGYNYAFYNTPAMPMP
jgi:hypothetical protein